MSNNNEEKKDSGIFKSERGTPAEYMEDYQFSVEEASVFTLSGIEIPSRRAIVRTDTNEILGLVGSNYKVLSHRDALDPILERLTERNINMFKRIALTEGGAKMFASVYFPGNEKNAGGDKFWPGITIVNSLDGMLKYSIEASIYRLVCTNGLRVPTAVAKFTKTHSKNMNFGDVVDEILDFVSNENHFAQLTKWANMAMNVEEMKKKAKSIVNTKACTFPVRYLPQVEEEIDREAEFNTVSVWGLRNAFNSVIEHYMIREKGKLGRARLLDENLNIIFSKMFK